MATSLFLVSPFSITFTNKPRPIGPYIYDLFISRSLEGDPLECGTFLSPFKIEYATQKIKELATKVYLQDHERVFENNSPEGYEY